MLRNNKRQTAPRIELPPTILPQNNIYSPNATEVFHGNSARAWAHRGTHRAATQWSTKLQACARRAMMFRFHREPRELGLAGCRSGARDQDDRTFKYGWHMKVSGSQHDATDPRIFVQLKSSTFAPVITSSKRQSDATTGSSLSWSWHHSWKHWNHHRAE